MSTASTALLVVVAVALTSSVGRMKAALFWTFFLLTFTLTPSCKETDKERLKPTAPKVAEPTRENAEAAEDLIREKLMGEIRVDIDAVYNEWDIGDSVPAMDKETRREVEKAGPEMRQLAAFIPFAPREHSVTFFATIHPARRMSGATEVRLDREDAQAIRAATSEVLYRGRVCADATGKTLFVLPILETGVPNADRRIERTLMTWRFAPYEPMGIPTPFCTGVEFRFVQSMDGARPTKSIRTR